MIFSSKNPAYISMLGSLSFHSIFIVFAGYYIVSQDRLVPPVKKIYKLKVIEKKKVFPIEKKRIHKMVRKKQMRVFPIQPTISPKIQPQAQIMQMTKVLREQPAPVIISLSLNSNPTVTRQALVQTASVSPLRQSYSMVSRPKALTSTTSSLKNTRISSNGSRLIEKGIRKTIVPVFHSRTSQSNNFPSDGKGFLRTTFYSENISRFSYAAFQPRPVPNIKDQGALKGYANGVQRKIASRKKYPKKARDRGMEGQVTVQFTILKSGNIKNLKVISRTSYDILNKAALNAIRKAAPFPNLPEEIDQGFLQLELPFKFEIKK